MDNTIDHDTKAALDAHEERIAAIEDHLGLSTDDEDTEDEETENGEDEDTEDGE